MTATSSTRPDVLDSHTGGGARSRGDSGRPFLAGKSTTPWCITLSTIADITAGEACMLVSHWGLVDETACTLSADNYYDDESTSPRRTLR